MNRFKKIPKLLPALKSTWVETSQARAVWRTAIETFVFFLLSRLRRSPNWLFHFRLRGMPFTARTVDYNALNEVLVHEEYRFIEVVLKDIAGTPVIVDGGANIGLFALYALSIRPDALVHCMEPSKATFQVLAQNSKLNGSKAWNVHQTALWKEDGVITFENRGASTSSRIAQLSQTSDGAVETVPAISLGSFMSHYIPARVNLLKLDIEGAEEEVLTSGVSILSSVDNLVVEIHPTFVNEQTVMNLVSTAFPYVHRISGRESSKPLILASRVCKDLHLETLNR